MDLESAARTALAERIASDKLRIDAHLLDRWMPQVSSKRLGITDPRTGITYDTYAEIREDHDAQRRRFGDVLLFESSAYRSYESSGFYVSVVNAPKSSGAEVMAWCSSNGLDRNDCFPTMISNTVTPNQVAAGQR